MSLLITFDYLTTAFGFGFGFGWLFICLRSARGFLSKFLFLLANTIVAR